MVINIRDGMFVGINPILNCNLNCEYCFLHSEDSKKRISEQKNADYHSAHEWYEGLVWLNDNVNTIINLDIFGGEPLLYEDIGELINAIPLEVHIGLDTNSIKYERLSEIHKDRRTHMHLLISVHLDGNGNIPRRYHAAAEKVKELGFNNVTVNFVAYPKQIRKADIVRTFATEYGFAYHLEPYINYNPVNKGIGKFDSVDDEKYAWDRFTEADKSGLIKLKKRKYPIKCFIGKSYLLVMENGNIFNCWGKMMAGEKPIGNIFRKEISEIPDEIDCNVFCVCSQNWRDGFS